MAAYITEKSVAGINTQAHTDKYSKELGKLRFMLNLDSCGGPGKKGLIIHNSPELEPIVKQAEEEMKSEIPFYQMVKPYSDHWPFFIRGVPCGSGGDPEKFRSVQGRGYSHTRYDTLDKIDLTNLRSAASNYTRLILRMANRDEWKVKRKSRKAINAFIKKQGYDMALELNNKLKEYVGKWKKLHPETKSWIKRRSAW